MKNKFALVPPSEAYASEIAAYREEFLAAGDSMDGCGSLRRMADPIEYIKRSQAMTRKETVPEGLVQATQFLYVRQSDGRVVGMIQVRHYFNEYLKKYAGHIGYSVRPSERRQGYARAMLRATLPFCKEIGLDRVLISCVDGNIGSEKTILSCGGVYESTVYLETEDLYLKRFWITLQ